jgi:hypothetical protein
LVGCRRPPDYAAVNSLRYAYATRGTVSEKGTHMQQAAAPGIVFLLFGIFCAYWAQNTGRNPWLWFFMGWFFAPIAGIALLIKNSQRPPTLRP